MKGFCIYIYKLPCIGAFTFRIIMSS